MQHSTINQADPKRHVSNNQHNNTPLKDTKLTAMQIIDRVLTYQPIIEFEEPDWSLITTSKKSPASPNNFNSINQPNQVGINKSQKQTIIQKRQKQLSKRTIKSSNITKQQSTSTNISLKRQHSTINQADPKRHVSNNQHNNTPLKDTKLTAMQIIDRVLTYQPIIEFEELDWSLITTSKKSPASPNNFNSINQPNQVGINKSQKQTIIQKRQKQLSKRTIKSSNITKQQSISTNISLKRQHSTINQADPKRHVSNNQHNNTPLKDTKPTAMQIIDRVLTYKPIIEFEEPDWSLITTSKKSPASPKNL
ncbi:uncharacterized protein LOC126549692 [Aphis gossypii]|uniref:uncharacterized protein LOC126549692 n=1 Tax=Aphis gossypii TaxID=80765 RepID=UPI0021594E3E|nr:uncharacterized protein LOC126549692 [Aphis gossypii]XP_050055685.1 uncharacterized protein LOC126549692 [Aphis gossypii]XP_050055686.1 uncharacterized protein LOC126549692 [Aphis gossypii]XP_050055687.1 uncharacterized protein LOC126549692 [Aphis gossypii]